MEAALLVREARRRARLTLRALAERAGTSHATLAAYEAGTKVPRTDTLVRILAAAGFVPQVDLAARPIDDAGRRSRELVDALHLAEQFPARHRRTLAYPRFGR